MMDISISRIAPKAVCCLHFFSLPSGLLNPLSLASLACACVLHQSQRVYVRRARHFFMESEQPFFLQGYTEENLFSLAEVGIAHVAHKKMLNPAELATWCFHYLQSAALEPDRAFESVSAEHGMIINTSV